MQDGIEVLEVRMNMLPQTGTWKCKTREEKAETMAVGELTFVLAQMECFPEILGLNKHTSPDGVLS